MYLKENFDLINGRNRHLLLESMYSDIIMKFIKINC